MKKNQLTSLTLVAGLLCYPFLLSGSCQAAPAARDHVLLVTIDDLNDWIGCLSDTVKPENKSKLRRLW